MFNPAKASNQIRDKFINYITTSYPLSDQKIRNQFKKSLYSVISKGPIIEINDIFKFGKTINELISEEVICKEFRNIEKLKSGIKPYDYKIPLNRPLYLHQEKAIRKVINGRSIVVSTGTGSGKTESFIIPILNELVKEYSEGTLDDGVRAILIYPMNALANDQLKRIREILLQYPFIKFGVYNGSTEHNEKNAQGLYKAMFKNEIIPELRESLKNEILSREKLQEHPPHILFTNYAMLEHMLLRPNDGKVFTNSKFKFIVLDEAHVYYGTTGMETSMLIRRLKARISYKKPPQFILTSATLGSSSDSDNDIVNFANNLTGEQFSSDDIIRAERQSFVKQENLINYPNQLFIDLCAETLSTKEVLKNYKIEFNINKELNEIYYDLCNSSRLFNEIRTILNEPKELSEIAYKLNVSEDLIISIMHIAAQGYKEGSVLINIRYHYFLRALEGLYLSLYPDCELSLIRKTSKIVDGYSIPFFEIATCGDCGRIALVGKQNKTLRVFESKQVDNLDEADYYFVNFNKDDTLFEEEDDSIVENSLKTYLCTKCGSIMESDELLTPPCDCIKDNKIEIIKTKKTHKCPACGVGKYNRFYLGNDAATSVIGSSLYDELPEYNFIEPKIELETNSDNPFDVFSENTRKDKITNSRQFLIFSDSRQDAAYFSSYLSSSYKQFIRRRAIFNLINENKESEVDIKVLVDQLSALFSNPNNQSFAEKLNSNENLSSISKRNAWIGILDEMVNQNRTTSLCSLGYIYFEYKGNDNDNLLNNIGRKFNVDSKTIKNLLNKLINDLIRFGAIDTSKISELMPEDKEEIFFTPNQKSIVMNRDDKVEFKPSMHFIPSLNPISGKYYKTNRLELVKKTLKINDNDAANFISGYWSYLTGQSNTHRFNSYDGINYVIDLKSIRITSNFNKNENVYKCKKCGKITSLNINNNCSDLKCNGILESISVHDEHEDNHYVKLYSDSKFKPLIIKEHTAQLSKRESLDYQKEFVLKEINALSCSTTFEMGVDVGGLETVYLRNMPPLPSNYAQRAGRAGRSKLSAAYALTYSKLSSHDFNYFKDPLKMIKGTIYPPIFKNDNKKIIQRHINSVALSYFFSIYPEEYNGNKIEKFVDNKGYLKLIDLLDSNPDELKEILLKSFPKNLHSIAGINDFSWTKNFIGEIGTLTQVISNYENILEELEKNQNIAFKQKDHITASRYGSLIYKFKDKQLIEFLAKGNVLPRYGFPVDTVELMQYMKSDKKSEYELNLSRDLQLAISEYAPGSQIVADGKLFTSRYIRKVVSKRKHWEEGKIAVCNDKNCGTVNFRKFILNSDDYKCTSCGKPIPKIQWRQSIEPRAGFVTEEEVKPVPMTKPEKVYKTEEFYISDSKSRSISIKEVKFSNNTITFESTENDALLIKTSSDFYVCTSCGYTLNENEINLNLKQSGNKYIDNKYHNNLHTHKCDNKTLSLYNIHHIFYTDVLKITFSKDITDRNQAFSILSALLDAFSRILDIERSDLKGTVHKRIDNNKKNVFTFVIYDAVAGGVGYTRKLISGEDNEVANLVKRVLRNAYDVTKNCECEPSCYLCLRNYGNQKYHEVLDRRRVYDYLEDYINTDDIQVNNIQKEENSWIEDDNFVINKDDFYLDIKDWSELHNYCSANNSLIFEILENISFDFPDYCIGTITVLDNIQLNVDAIWIKHKIIVPSDIEKSDYFEKLSSNSDWKIINTKSEIEEIING